MKKLLAIALCVAFACFGSYAADLDIGTHANFFIPPEGGSQTVMAGVDVEYRTGPYLSIRGSLDNANYTVDTHNYMLTSVSATLIGHILGSSPIDPYVGAGIGYYDKKVDGASKSDSTGLNAVAGVAAHFQTFNAGIEVKYTLPDTRHMESGFYSIGGQMTGGLHISL